MDKKFELPKPYQRGGDLMLSFIRRFAVIVAIAGVSVSLPSYSWAQDDAKPTHAESDHDHAEGDHDHAEGGDDHGGHEADHDDAAHADAGHGDGHTPPLLSFDAGSAFCNLAIFAGVFFVLSKFVWPVILGGLKAREEKIHGDLEAAEQATAEAKGLLAEYQTKLDDAASQVQSMLAEARRDAEASGQRIVEEAKAEAQRQSERAIADIETAKKVAISDIAGQTSDMAITVAKQVVGRELKADDHAELIRQSLERLPSNN
jgi:F-type H+-transporting ATPase subunit b